MPRALTTIASTAVLTAATVPPLLKRMGAPALPNALLTAAAALAPHWKAIALQRAVRRLARMHARRKKQRIVKGTTDGLLERAALERATAPASSPALLRDMTLQELCSYFNTELQEIKRLLLPSGLQMSVARWDRSNSELMRFAVSCGMLEVRYTLWCFRDEQQHFFQQATTVHERKMAIAETVMKVTDTVRWSAQQKWLNKAELHRWEPLVRHK